MRLPDPILKFKTESKVFLGNSEPETLSAENLWGNGTIKGK